MFTVDFDLSDVKRALLLAQGKLENGARRAVILAAQEGLAESKARRRYKDHTGTLTGTAYARTITLMGRNPQSVICWPTPYARFVEEGTKPHDIWPKEGHGFKGPLRSGQSRRAKTDIGTHRIALRWYVSNQAVFAKMVHHPGSEAMGFAGDAYRKAERVLEREAMLGLVEARVVLG